MARPSMAPQRNLTLTEELEKLEQSITLTLQEIDHNFSRAHRIVTTSILPVVEKYAEHSQNVWESSKFWKQFFEASANVSLSGYEEPPEQDETVTEDATTTSPSASTYGSPSQIQSENNASTTPQASHHQHPTDDSSFSATPVPRQTTPRAKPKQPRPSIATYSSPYETLKREIKGQQPPADDNSTLPSTPRNPSQQREDDDSPTSSIFLPPSTAQKAPHRTPKDNPLLHRVLDKNWRIQATPHTTTKTTHQTLPYRGGRTPARNNSASTPSATAKKKGESDDDLDSSPALAAPELDSEIFGTPARRGRIPGVSVLTPAGKGKGKKTSNRTPSTQYRKRGGGPQTPSADEEEEDDEGPRRGRGVWDSDSDDDEEGLAAGMSPPKTMQFHVPQTRLLRTPAREASKRIVEDLLLTAGGNVTDEFGEEDSPSVVRRGALEEDDTF